MANMTSKTKEINLLGKFIIFGYLPLGVLIAMLTPDNILEYPWARTYTDFMASLIPYIAEVGRWTKVPATQFIAALMNLVAILISISMIYGPKYNSEENIKGFSELPIKKQVMLLISVPFCIGGFYFLLFSVPFLDPPRGRDLTIIGSKLGMGLLGSFHIAAGWLILAMGVVVAVSFFMLMKRHYTVKRV